jgi:hypothetical protein
MISQIPPNQAESPSLMAAMAPSMELRSVSSLAI